MKSILRENSFGLDWLITTIYEENNPFDISDIEVKILNVFQINLLWTKEKVINIKPEDWTWIGDISGRRAQLTPDRIAIIDNIEKQQYSFADKRNS